MLIQNWHYQLLGTIPEAIATVALGTALIKEKFTFKQISLAGLIIGAISFLLQQSPIKYGVHIPLGIITFILTLNIVLKLNVFKSAASALLSFIILIFIEALAFYVQVNMFNYSEEMLIDASEVTRFLFSLPPLFFLIILAWAAQVWLRLRLKEKDVK